jgi:hypothetical protein
LPNDYNINAFSFIIYGSCGLDSDIFNAAFNMFYDSLNYWKSAYIFALSNNILAYSIAFWPLDFATISVAYYWNALAT